MGAVGNPEPAGQKDRRYQQEGVHHPLEGDGGIIEKYQVAEQAQSTQPEGDVQPPPVRRNRHPPELLPSPCHQQILPAFPAYGISQIEDWGAITLPYPIFNIQYPLLILILILIFT